MCVNGGEESEHVEHLEMYIKKFERDKRSTCVSFYECVYECVYL